MIVNSSDGYRAATAAVMDGVGKSRGPIPLSMREPSETDMQTRPGVQFAPVHIRKGPIWTGNRLPKLVDLAVVLAGLSMVILRPYLASAATSPGGLFRTEVPLGPVAALGALTMLWIWLFERAGVYGRGPEMRGRRGVLRILAACAPAAVGTHLLLRLAFPGAGASGSLWVWLWLAMSAATVATHQLWAWVARLPRQYQVRNVLIVGTGARAQRRFADLTRDTETTYHVVGFVDANVASDLPAWESPILGGVGDLKNILSQFVIDEVHIALPVKSHYDDFETAIRTCAAVGVQTVYPLDAFDVREAYPRLECARDVPDIRLKVVPHADDMIHKRVLDILLSGAALLALSPVLLAVAAAVKVSSPGPVIFSQQRFGKHRRPFRLYKFRSMRADSEEVLRRDPALYAEYVRNNFKLPEDRDPRLTPIGAFLRKTSLDEMPQLWNVLKGDMAIVGPRPIIDKEIEWYGPLSSLLLAVKPGLVGAWVTGGRSQVGYPQRTDLELGYVKEWSLEQDLKIMARAVPTVLSGRGAH